MATKKTIVSQLPEAGSLEGLRVFATDNENRSVQASITLLKGNKGDKGDTGAAGAAGAAGKAPRVNGSTGIWEVWDNNTSAWVSTGVDASSGYVLTKEAIVAVLGSVYTPVNEIRYSTAEAGNIFGDKYLKCDGSFVRKGDYPTLCIPEAGIKFLKADNPDTGYNLTDIAYGNGIYVCSVGRGARRIYISPDLKEWHVVNTTIGISTFGLGIVQSHFVNGEFYSLWYANLGNGYHVIRKSVDGINWEMVQNTFGEYKVFVFYAYADGIHVVAGDKQVWTKTGEGQIAQREIGTTSSNILGLAYGNGIFVVVASDRSLITSTDGLAWTNRGVSILPLTPTGLIFANGIFVVVCSSIILTSTNGIDWVQMDSIGINIEGIGYGSGTYAAKVAGEVYQRYLYTSLDLINWESHDYFGSNYFSQVLCANDILFALGYSGYYGISIDALQLPSIENAYIKALE